MADKKVKKTQLPKANVVNHEEEDDGDDIPTVTASSFSTRFVMLQSDDETGGHNDDDDDEKAPQSDDADGEGEKKLNKTPTAASSKPGAKKKGAAKKKAEKSSKTTKHDEEVESLVAAIESTSVSTKKGGKKKGAAAQAATTETFNEGEGQDLESLLKEIDEQFEAEDRRKEAKKEKKRKKKEEAKEEATAVPEVKPIEAEIANKNEATTIPKPVPTQDDQRDVAAEATSSETVPADEKKSKNKKKKGPAEKKGPPEKKGGLDAKTVEIMKQLRAEREQELNKQLIEEKERERQEEEREKQRIEQLRIEKEKKELKKQKEKDRIKRKKEEGTYLTKEQREKRERARVQLAAAGVQVPTDQPSAASSSANGVSTGQPKKRVIYDDRRKKLPKESEATESRQKPTTRLEPSAFKNAQPKNEDNLKDNWEQDSEEEEAPGNIWDADETQSVATTTTENGTVHLDHQVMKSTGAPSRSRSGGDETSESESDDESDDSDESSSSEDDYDDPGDKDLPPMERVRLRFQRRREEYEKRRSSEFLRAPVICVLGHVDTGKTKILDNLRRTHVQDGEAGGITQQIGATNVPLETMRERTKMCRKMISREGEYIVPGLLIIDTPGHESFKNLRSRGSSLCDLAILVVDIMHGLEPQTLESIKLLMDRRTPFIIALNKIDRLYSWKSDNKKNVEQVLEEQIANTKNEFDKRCKEVILQFAEQGLNAALYYNNPDEKDFFSMVPTSAVTGDGMGSLIALIIEKCQTTLAKRLSFTEELQATVMEVKAIGGLGTTIDVVLVNGKLREGNTIIVAGQEGPIITQVRGLLMPEPNKELRVRNQYQKYKEIKGARGVKIAAKDLEKAMAGLPLFVGRNDDEVEYFKNEIQTILKSALSSIKLKENGVHVQASTLGSLEALLEFLKSSNIPYASINIGPVHRKDVIRTSAQLEREAQWAVILAFDVRIEKEAQEHADNVGVTIFQADIIYHLFDKFIAHRERLKKENQDKYRNQAVFPCKLRVLPQYIFNSRDPIICGVIVEDGFVKLGTPICVPSKEFLELGRVASIEFNHKALDLARKGQEVCIKIENTSGDAPKMFGRHFDETDILTSKISRETIDIVKEYFRDDMQKQDWQLMLELKKTFNIL